MWLDPMPDLNDLRQVYSDGYFSNAGLLQQAEASIYGYVDYVAERVNKQYGYLALVGGAREALSRDGSLPAEGKARWMDVGCGLGYLLDVAFDQGFAASGLEFNRHAVAYVRSKYTYDVREGTIADMPPGERYHVISLLDVVEHLRDPFSDLEHLRARIHDGGRLLISTMDSDSLVSRLLGKRLEDFRRIREHLFFFSRPSLTAVLEACGWEVVSIESIGHTFEFGMLLDRLSSMAPRLARVLRGMVRPRWLLSANVYVNPRTKMLVTARPRPLPR
jgi:2-polyprenyl-3-methyl-5-hydroxy-6-metoxy-1,4-benzoquinol methylase